MLVFNELYAVLFLYLQRWEEKLNMENIYVVWCDFIYSNSEK